jgi:hypothetical protein
MLGLFLPFFLPFALRRALFGLSPTPAGPPLLEQTPGKEDGNSG